MKERKTFWDKNAGRYDRFMRKDRAAYDEMYALIRPVVKAKTVLELATGTGLIAKHIVNAAAHIEATDASAEMIAEAKRDNRSAKLHFSVQDMFLSLIHILTNELPLGCGINVCTKLRQSLLHLLFSGYDFFAHNLRSIGDKIQHQGFRFSFTPLPGSFSPFLHSTMRYRSLRSI